MKAKNEYLNSQFFAEKIGQCESEEEYLKLIKINQKYFRSWDEYIIPRMKEKKIKVKDIAKYCGIDLKTASSILKKVPAKRENAIALGILLEMNLEEVNYLLTHETKFHKLYPKNSKDAIWIYMIESHTFQESRQEKEEITIKEQFNNYCEKYQMLVEKYRKDKKEETQNPLKESTKILIQKWERERDFEKRMNLLIPNIEEGYLNLIDYLYTAIEKFGGIQNFYYVEEETVVAKNQLYYRELRALKKNHEIPSRIFLIALGIHLNLTTNEIDKILEYAGMIPLYSKDLLESKIYYYLENLLILNEISFLNDDMEKETKRDQDLAEYIYERMREDEVLFSQNPSFEKLMKLL